MRRNGNLARSRMDLKTVAVQIPYLGCLRIFNDEVSADIAQWMPQTQPWEDSVSTSPRLFVGLVGCFDHGPQTGAMRLTSGACSLMISMTMCRPLEVITSNPVRMSTRVPTLRPVSAQHWLNLALPAKISRTWIFPLRTQFQCACLGTDVRSSKNMLSAG